MLQAIIRSPPSLLAKTTPLNQITSSSSCVLRSPLVRQFHNTDLQRSSNSTSNRSENPSQILRDENIKSRRVRLVDPQTNELMPGPFDTKELLASIDRKRYILQQVSPGKEIEQNQKKNVQQDDQENESSSSRKNWRNRSQTSQEGSISDQTKITNQETQAKLVLTLEDLPIVKLIDKKESYDKQRAAKKQKQTQQESSSSDGMILSANPQGKIVKSDTSLHKEVMLTWQSSMHDVKHKLQPMRANMIKRGAGASCRITINSKKGKGGIMDLSKKLSLLQELEDFLCDWSNANRDIEESSEPSDLVSSERKLSYYPRRRGEIIWQKNEKTAILVIEVIKR